MHYIINYNNKRSFKILVNNSKNQFNNTFTFVIIHLIKYFFISTRAVDKDIFVVDVELSTKNVYILIANSLDTYCSNIK